MSITFPAAYSAKIKNRSVTVDWLFQLYYDNEGANDWIGIAEKDRDVSSVHYYGNVIDSGLILSEIDLLESLAREVEDRFKP